MRIGYLGPEGTFSHEALLAAEGEAEAIGFSTIHDTIEAVAEREVERALVPIENSLEGSVNATLDALVACGDEVTLAGELLHPIHHCLIVAQPLQLDAISTIVSHPQAVAQCGQFIREQLAGAPIMPANSTAEAVRLVAEHGGDWAAVGNHLSAALQDCQILREGIADRGDNETRFVWLAPRDEGPALDGAQRAIKTSLVFWGVGADAPGWLVRCLSEFAFRGVNLTRIESRPRKRQIGRYMFFIDLEGGAADGEVAGAIDALRRHVEELRILGSYPAAQE